MRHDRAPPNEVCQPRDARPIVHVQGADLPAPVKLHRAHRADGALTRNRIAELHGQRHHRRVERVKIEQAPAER